MINKDVEELNNIINQQNLINIYKTPNLATRKYTEPKNTPKEQSQLVFDKGAKAVQWKQDSVFNKWCQSHWISMGKINEAQSKSDTTYKIKSKWIIDLNIKHKIIMKPKRKSSETRAWRRVLRHDNKSTVHKRKNLISWTSLK